ncbi:MAG: DUF6261 family protein [Paludibacter sp.]
MSNFLFTVLYVAKLSINNAFSLFKTSIELARIVELQLNPVLVAALNQFATDNEKFGKQINKNQKSALTDDMKPLDDERDSLFSIIKRAVNSFQKSSDPASKAAAKLLYLLLTPYWKAGSLPLNSETDILDELLAKYKASPELKAAAVALNVDATFTLLETKNTAFKALYQSRITEFAAREKASGTSLKPATVASYIQFCTALEQAVNLTPNAESIALFNKLDELRKKYHLLEGGGKDTPPDVPPVV